MNWKRNGMLLLLAAALAGWYYFYEIRGSEKRALTEIESSRVVPGVDAAQVRRISIDRIADLQDEMVSANRVYRMVFSKSDGQWSLKEPVEALCDQMSVESLADQLVQLRRGRLVAENPDDPGTYGLESPAFVINLEYETGQARFRLGDENPAGDSLYASFGDNPAVYIIDNAVRSELIRKANDYRNRRIVSVSSDSINSLDIEFPGTSFKLELVKKDDSWTVNAGKEFPGDDQRIREIVAALTAQSITDFIDEPVDPDHYGLREPFIRIRTGTADLASILIEVGNHADPGGKTRYTRIAGSGPVMIVKKEFYDVFKADAFHYRSKTVCDMNRDVVDRIVIEKPGETIELVRDETGAWRMTDLAEGKTDSQVVGSFLSGLTYLRATGIKPEEEPFGPTGAVIRLFSNSSPEAPVTQLEIGGTASNGVGRWVKSSDSTDVLRISETDANPLIPDRFHFQDKTFLRFEKNEVKAIRIERGDRSVEIKPEESTWKMTQPADAAEGSWTAETMEAVFLAIHDLQMDAVAQRFDSVPNDADLDQFGLRNPVMTVQILLSNNRVETIRIGRTGPDRSTVWKERDSVIALIENDRLEPLLSLEWGALNP